MVGDKILNTNSYLNLIGWNIVHNPRKSRNNGRTIKKHNSDGTAYYVRSFDSVGTQKRIWMINKYNSSFINLDHCQINGSEDPLWSGNIDVEEERQINYDIFK